MPAIQQRLNLTDPSILHTIRSKAIRPTPPSSPTTTPNESLARCIVDQIDPAAQFVLVGEASHGTHEFYQVRAEVTKLLITERGFGAVAAEADFPDAFKANLWVKGFDEECKDADDALGEFLRFPTWMWRNKVMVDFINWLKEHNSSLPSTLHHQHSVGFYGMDVYSLHASARKVIEFLRTVDPAAAKKAEARYACFDRYGEDTQAYAYAVGMGGEPSCASAAIGSLVDIIKGRANYAVAADGAWGKEMVFQAHANAAVVVDAERYYRNMFFGDELTWNIRDSHFLDAVRMITSHLRDLCPDRAPKVVLWAHNSHLGDARATDMGQRRGELNIGQLMREEYGMNKVYNVGFTTHTGTVTAADEWEAPGLHKDIRKSMPGSYENLFHRTEIPHFVLDLRNGGPELREALAGPLLERAIGVIYRPKTERQSHYFYTELPRQFDIMCHMDETTALEPLEPHHEWKKERMARQDAPETYPFGV